MDTQLVPVAGKLSKKQIRKSVYEKLATALADYKAPLSEKKFENKLKKASKLFATDLAKALNKEGKNRKKSKQKQPVKTVNG